MHLIRPHFSSALLALFVALPAAAQEPDKDKKTPPAKEDSVKPKSVPSLPEGVLNFYGKVTGTVEAVDAKGFIKVKVTRAEADPEKNKASKPEALAGMTITVTPLAKTGEGDKAELDPAALAYINGAKAGDQVTLNVRASSKGVVFRLLKVPTAAGAK